MGSATVMVPVDLPTLGDLGLLTRPSAGLLASVRVPPDLILPALDGLATLGRADVTIIGGFQTPLEKAILRGLIRRGDRAVVCLSTTLAGRRFPRAWSAAIDAGRLLVVSAIQQRRPTSAAAIVRNQLITRLSDTLVVIHATTGGRVYRTVANAAERGGRVYCFRHPRNADLELIRARPIDDFLEIPRLTLPSDPCQLMSPGTPPDRESQRPR